MKTGMMKLDIGSVIPGRRAESPCLWDFYDDELSRSFANYTRSEKIWMSDHIAGDSTVHFGKGYNSLQNQSFGHVTSS